MIGERELWLEKRVEELERANELLGKGHTGVAAAIAAEYRAKAGEAEVERLRDELTGKKAVERSQMRRYALSLQANLACPCGSILQATQELDAHLDHMCNDERWRDAAFAPEVKP